MNCIYRSLKSARYGRLLAAHLDAAESIAPMLDVVFALEGRVRPYNSFLEWELERFPLAVLPVRPEALLSLIERIAASGDVAAQRELFALVEPLVIDCGWGDVIEAWNDLSILRTQDRD